jgi:hypothetical protein
MPSEETMTIRRRVGLLSAAPFVAGLAATLAAAPVARAQESSPDTAGIHAALRAFYYSLAHRDWEAIAGQVLPAKVVAHRPPPDAMVIAATSPDRAAGLRCGESRVRADGAWAEVSAIRCRGAARATDEFRLIRFEERWRIVYIDLVDETVMAATRSTNGTTGGPPLAP